MTFWRYAGWGAVAILIFDAVGASLSKATGLPYAWFSLGSFAVQGYVGFLAARAATTSSGVRAAAFVALVESTAGWWISSAIGPGRASSFSAGIIVFTIVFVVGLGAIAGLVGASLARRGRAGVAT